MSVRIITGLAKGRRLKSPSGDITRPMTGRAREAVFSSIGPGIAGARVLDLYAGTGSLGLEALSRGAASAVFVEKSPVVRSILEDNIRAVGLGGEVVGRAVGDYLLSVSKRTTKSENCFDLIFMDPPYSLPDSVVVSDLRHVVTMLKSEGRIVLHRPNRGSVPRLAALEVVHQHRIGSAAIWRLRKVRLSSG